MLGGGLAAPSMGLSTMMGETLILNALICAGNRRSDQLSRSCPGIHAGGTAAAGDHQVRGDLHFDRALPFLWNSGNLEAAIPRCPPRMVQAARLLEDEMNFKINKKNSPCQAGTVFFCNGMIVGSFAKSSFSKQTRKH